MALGIGYQQTQRWLLSFRGSFGKCTYYVPNPRWPRRGGGGRRPGGRRPWGPDRRSSGTFFRYVVFSSGFFSVLCSFRRLF